MIGPDVKPPPAQLARAVESVVPGIYRDIVIDARGVLGQWPDVKLESWWRSVAHNADIKGAQASQHLVGLAFDWIVPRRDWYAVARFLRDANWTVIDEGNHLHSQVFKATSNVVRFVAWASRFA